MSGRRLGLGLLALLALAAASDRWIIFQGQVNGPVTRPFKIDVETFRHHQFPGLFWAEVYYHHFNCPDGSMLTVQITFDPRKATVAFVYDTPTIEPFTDYVIVDYDHAVFDQKGFGITLDKNRFWLEGDQYHLHLELSKTTADITYQIRSASYSYGDSMLRYPDGKSFVKYTLPITWATARADLVLDGKKAHLDGYADLNHDSGVVFPTNIPSNWQVFWFFGEDHALAVTDFIANKAFGEVPVQRLVFVDQSGRQFTSTRFAMNWDDWIKAKDIPFRYPRHYTLSAEGGGGRLEAEVRVHETLLREDLYSNLPTALRIIAKYWTRNYWTYDAWCDYELSYTEQGQTRKYQGRGIARWTHLEEE